MDAAHPGSRHDDGIRTLPVEEFPHRRLLGEIQLVVAAHHEPVMALLLQRPHDGRTDQATVAGDVNFRVFSDVHGVLLVMAVNFVTFLGDHGISLGELQIGVDHVGHQLGKTDLRHPP